MATAAEAILHFNFDDAHKLFGRLDHIHLVAILPDAPKTAKPHGRYFGSDVGAALEWGAQVNGNGWNLYWTLNYVGPSVGTKPSKGDIQAARGAHCDLDPPKDGSAWDKTAAIDALTGHSAPPSLIIDSGNGVQPAWLLGSPAKDWQPIEAINIALRDKFGGDDCHNIDRLLRVPGSVNYPNKTKRARGYVPCMASWVLEDTGQRYEPDELAAAFPATSRPKSAGSAANDTSERVPTQTGALIAAVLSGENWHNNLLRLTAHLVAKGRSTAEILAMADGLTLPGYTVEETRSDMRGMIDDARGKWDYAEPADPATDTYSPRAVINVRAGELHLMATEGERALMIAGAPIYARGDRIVRPIVDDMQAANGLRTKVARLTDVGCDSMVDHLSRSADWLRFDGRKKETVPTDPPVAVARTILSRDGEWSFPRLAGVITTPTLRPDGSMLCEPGFDPQTQLLLIDPPKLPIIAEKPTRSDALAALATLDALLSEFPFVDEASRSVALSGLITPVVRGALPVAPLHAVAAPVAGSGKSYIVDVASAIATGQRAPVIAAGSKDEETEKRLISALLNGQAIISIDNVNGHLGGDVLCQMIERPLVSVRPLGVSKLVRMESRATTFATGNNIQLVGDMTRRVVLCSLDPNLERPELRQFSARPFDLVLADRGKYIAAALTIARAYVVAGCPKQCPPLASFEDWSRVVRSALVWLGRADPIETMETARTEDPTTSSLRALFGAWADTIGDAERTSAQVKERAREEYMGSITAPELHQAIYDVAQGNRGEIDAKRLGHFLTRHKGRIVDGLKLKDRYDSHRKVNVWSVVRV